MNFDPVWTGTRDTTVVSAPEDNCVDWTTQEAGGPYGLIGNPERQGMGGWSYGGRLRCNGLAFLYCFEQ